ncbi:MAG: ATP-binding protein [Bacteroidota bacterium]|nr:ATP-binding protein [Bacteroidota bacterium]
MHPGFTAQVVSRQNDFTLFVVVISLSFFIMSVFLVVVVMNIYRQRVRNQKKLLDAIYTTQENERTRIAEDLHDSIGASLSALKLRIDAIREDSTDPGSSQLAGDSITLLDDVIGNLRNIIRNQTSKYLLTNGFASELMRFRSYFSDHNKIQMEIELTEPLPDLNNNFGINLFRIIQELVNNSVKHSQCDAISIRISKEDHHLNLRYKDNGIGFNSDLVKEKGMGLTNVDARTKLFDGQYTLESEQGKHTSYNFYFNYSIINPA